MLRTSFFLFPMSTIYTGYIYHILVYFFKRVPALFHGKYMNISSHKFLFFTKFYFCFGGIFLYVGKIVLPC